MAAAESIKAFECRVFEKLLKSKFKNANYRRKVTRNTLTELVEKERVETSLARAKDVARVANRVSQSCEFLLKNSPSSDTSSSVIYPCFIFFNFFNMIPSYSKS